MNFENRHWQIIDNFGVSDAIVEISVRWCKFDFGPA